jgi:hypothetical protein
VSSPLDGRIRALAREEAAEAIRGIGVTTAPDTQGLQQQITDLHEHLHHAATLISRLEARLDALEAAAAGPASADTPVGATAEAPRSRARRKTSET